MYMVAMTRIMLLYTQECALITRPHALCKITVGPKSVLTLYCMCTCPKSIVCFFTSVVTLMYIQGKWLVLRCPLFGGFTGLEGSIGCQILGGLCPPPNLNVGGAGAPPGQPPSSYAPKRVPSCSIDALYSCFFILLLSQLYS